MESLIHYRYVSGIGRLIYVSVSIIMTACSLSFARKSDAAISGGNLTVISDGLLYRNRQLNKETPLAELKSGDEVKRIIERRSNIYKIELPNGKKGWIEPHRVSVAKDEKAMVSGRFDLKDSADLKAQYNSVELKKTEWAQVLSRKPGWIHIRLNDEREGWVMCSVAKYPGQIPSGSIGFLHLVLSWLVRITGSGIFSSILIIALYIIPPTLAFYGAKLLSIKIPALPNFVLKAFIIIITAAWYFPTFFTVLFASPMGNGTGFVFTMPLFIIGSLGVLIGIIKHDFFSIKVHRCPSCRHWTGSIYDMDRLSRNTVTTTTTYQNGARAKDTTVTEHWKNYCSCSTCNHTWSVHEIVTT